MNLHKAPAALLELFHLKTTGHQPTEFEERVLPVAVVNEHYGADLLEAGVTSSSGAITRSLTSPILNGPYRFFHFGCHITVGANAGTEIRLRAGLSIAGSVYCWLSALRIVSPVAGGTYAMPFSFPVPMVLPSGSDFTLDSEGDATGTDHFLNIRGVWQNLSGTR